MSTELFSTLPYKVADIKLADFARKSIWQKKKCPALWLFAKSMENPNH